MWGGVRGGGCGYLGTLGHCDILGLVVLLLFIFLCRRCFILLYFYDTFPSASSASVERVTSLWQDTSGRIPQYLSSDGIQSASCPSSVHLINVQSLLYVDRLPEQKQGKERKKRRGCTQPDADGDKITKEWIKRRSDDQSLRHRPALDADSPIFLTPSGQRLRIHDPQPEHRGRLYLLVLSRLVYTPATCFVCFGVGIEKLLNDHDEFPRRILGRGGASGKGAQDARDEEEEGADVEGV